MRTIAPASNLMMAHVLAARLSRPVMKTIFQHTTAMDVPEKWRGVVNQVHLFEFDAQPWRPRFMTEWTT
jgi:hypothetical protein